VVTHERYYAGICLETEEDDENHKLKELVSRPRFELPEYEEGVLPVV
jgi:hypothetical protein